MAPEILTCALFVKPFRQSLLNQAIHNAVVIDFQSGRAGLADHFQHGFNRGRLHPRNRVQTPDHIKAPGRLRVEFSRLGPREKTIRPLTRDNLALGVISSLLKIFSA